MVLSGFGRVGSLRIALSISSLLTWRRSFGRFCTNAHAGSQLVSAVNSTRFSSPSRAVLRIGRPYRLISYGRHGLPRPADGAVPRRRHRLWLPWLHALPRAGPQGG